MWIKTLLFQTFSSVRAWVGVEVNYFLFISYAFKDNCVWKGGCGCHVLVFTFSTCILILLRKRSMLKRWNQAPFSPSYPDLLLPTWRALQCHEKCELPYKTLKRRSARVTKRAFNVLWLVHFRTAVYTASFVLTVQLN